MSQKKPHLLLIDNYDSFTFNLQHLIAMHSSAKLSIKRNDEDFIQEIEQGMYDGVVIGPGPGSPENKAYFGFNQKVILDFGTQGLPILGICLGFQGIYHSFGGTLKVAALPMHGKISQLQLAEPSVLFKDVPNGINIMRYHSILADLEQAVPECLALTAYTQPNDSQAKNGVELMALEHREYPIYGVQFHPESFGSECGDAMIRNFVQQC